MFGASLSPGPNERPHASSSASMPNVHLRSPSRHSTIPFSHYAVHGTGLDAIPPLPAHTANIPSNINQGAFATTFSPLRTGQATFGGGYTTGTPMTPSKKRVLNYSSPSAKTHRSSPSRNNVSPGQFNLGYGNGTNVGMGFDDMLSQKYSQSPIGKESQRALLSPRKATRWISKTPFKVLDAPELAVSDLICGLPDDTILTVMLSFLGRLLPQSGLMVTNESSSCWPFIMCLPLVCRYLPGNKISGPVCH